MLIRNKVLRHWWQQNYMTSFQTMYLKMHPNSRLLDLYSSDSLLLCNVKMLLMSILMIRRTVEITQIWKFQTLKSLPLQFPICPMNNLVDHPGQGKKLIITVIQPCDCKSTCQLVGQFCMDVGRTMCWTTLQLWLFRPLCPVKILKTISSWVFRKVANDCLTINHHFCMKHIDWATQHLCLMKLSYHSSCSVVVAEYGVYILHALVYCSMQDAITLLIL